MGDIVNLRNVRKRKAREENARKADENRIRRGRSRSGKLMEKAETGRAAALLDAHRRERPGPPADGDDR